jgi:hypothetical protein
MLRMARIDVVTEHCVIDVIIDNALYHNQVVSSGMNSVQIQLPTLTATFCRMQINCSEGSCQIGKVQFNHSWTMNTVFAQLHPSLYDLILDNDFDISRLTAAELDLVERYGMFMCSGHNDYQGWSEFRLNVCIDGQSQPLRDINDNSHHYALNQGQSMTFDLTVPRAACSI